MLFHYHCYTSIGLVNILNQCVFLYFQVSLKVLVIFSDLFVYLYILMFPVFINFSYFST